jgi:hypothetical protein
LALIDALQLAVSPANGGSGFTTNDRRLPAVPGLPIIQLDVYSA